MWYLWPHSVYLLQIDEGKSENDKFLPEKETRKIILLFHFGLRKTIDFYSPELTENDVIGDAESSAFPADATDSPLMFNATTDHNPELEAQASGTSKLPGNEVEPTAGVILRNYQLLSLYRKSLKTSSSRMLREPMSPHCSCPLLRTWNKLSEHWE